MREKEELAWKMAEQAEVGGIRLRLADIDLLLPSKHARACWRQGLVLATTAEELAIDKELRAAERRRGEARGVGGVAVWQGCVGE